jgi:hypothetical protein
MIRSVSLSGCGWLIPYHVGVLKCLMERGIVCKDRTVLSGVSGGAIVVRNFQSAFILTSLQQNRYSYSHICISVVALYI